MKKMLEKIKCSLSFVFCCTAWFIFVMWPAVLLIYGIVFSKAVPLVCGLFFSVLFVMFSGDKVERR